MPFARSLSIAALSVAPVLGAHAAPAASVDFNPAWLAEPAFEADDHGFAYRMMRGDFIFTVELKGDPAGGAIGLRTAVGDVAFEVVLDKNGALSAQGRQAGATTLHPDVFQVERRGGQLRFSAAAFGQPLQQVASSALPAEQPIEVGVIRHAGVTIRNARWTVPAWAGLVPYKDYLGSRLELLDVRTGAREVVYATDAGIEAPNFTPDGKAITFNSGGRIYRLEVGTHKAVAIDTGKCVRNNNDHVISPDGKWLGISCHTTGEFEGQSVVYKVPIEGGAPIALTHAAPSYLHSWTPDGKAILFTGSRNGEFDIYRTSTDGKGEETKLTSGPALDDGSEYSRDGRHIYFNSARTGKMQLWRMNADGSEARQLTNDAFNNWFPHLSPDQQTIVFLSYQPDMQPDQHPYYQPVYLRAMPGGGGTPRVVAYLYGGQGTINVPSWSPDGRYVAFVSHTGKP